MSRPDIALLWEGLPWYAARSIGRLPAELRSRLQLLGTRPAVPMTGVEEQAGLPVVWLDRESRYTWSQLGLALPRLAIQTGWRNPCFNSLSDEVKRAGGRAVGMVDNCLKRNLRQALGRIVYHVAIKRRYDAWWVPGRSGQSLFSYFGERRRPVYTGLYSADGRIFNRDGAPESRSLELLYVGQFVERKNVVRLVEAFAQSDLLSRGWTLRMVGEGPLRAHLSGRPGVLVEPFLDARSVAARMRSAQAFVLPSLDEHWGVVLCEAGLCGCALLAADGVGAAEDLVTPASGLRFDPRSLDSMIDALRKLADVGIEGSATMGREAAGLAASFESEHWTAAFASIVRDLAPREVIAA